MKKLVYGVTIILAIFFGSTTYADYVIKLKNGRSVEVEKYWEEKEIIKFQYQGGVVSLSKKNILSIVKVEGKISARVDKPKEQSPPPKEVQVETRKASVTEGAKSTSSGASGGAT